MSWFQDDDFETYESILNFEYFDTDITLTYRRILQQGSRSHSAGDGVVVIALFPFSSHIPALISYKQLDSIIVIR